MKKDELKKIKCKNPYKFIWIFWTTTTVLCSTFFWWSDWLPDSMFVVILIIITCMATYALYLLYRYYSQTSIKDISFIKDGNIIITYQLFRNSGSRIYAISKNNIHIIVKGNTVKLLEKEKVIAKIYKGTLFDKQDWGWIISCFNK